MRRLKRRSIEELDKELERVRLEKELYDREQEIRAIRKQMRRFKAPTKTELIAAFLFVNFTVVEAYSMWAMIYLQDASALYVLITSVLAEPIAFAIYALKAYHGKKQEEAVKLERDKMALDHSSPAEDGMDEDADPEADAA